MGGGEYGDLGAEDIRDHGHGNIVDCAALIALDPVQIAHAHRRDEQDRGLLKSRMLAHHVRHFEAVDLRHDDVEQHDRYSVLEELFQTLSTGAGLDEVLAKIAEYRLIAQKLAW